VCEDCDPQDLRTLVNTAEPLTEEKSDEPKIPHIDSALVQSARDDKDLTRIVRARYYKGKILQFL